MATLSFVISIFVFICILYISIRTIEDNYLISKPAIKYGIVFVLIFMLILNLVIFSYSFSEQIVLSKNIFLLEKMCNENSKKIGQLTFVLRHLPGLGIK